MFWCKLWLCRFEEGWSRPRNCSENFDCLGGDRGKICRRLEKTSCWKISENCRNHRTSNPSRCRHVILAVVSYSLHYFFLYFPKFGTVSRNLSKNQPKIWGHHFQKSRFLIYDYAAVLPAKRSWGIWSLEHYTPILGPKLKWAYYDLSWCKKNFISMQKRLSLHLCKCNGCFLILSFFKSQDHSVKLIVTEIKSVRWCLSKGPCLIFEAFSASKVCHLQWFSLKFPYYRCVIWCSHLWSLSCCWRRFLWENCSRGKLVFWRKTLPCLCTRGVCHHESVYVKFLVCQAAI